MTQSGDRRAAILAAATFVDQWVRTQRAARNDALPTMASIGAPNTAKFAPTPPQIAPPAIALRETPASPDVVRETPLPVRPEGPAIVVRMPAPAPPVGTPPPPASPDTVLPAFDDTEALDLPAFEEPVAAPDGTSPVDPTPLVESARPVAISISGSRGSFAKVLAIAAGVGVLAAVGWGAMRYLAQPAGPKTGTVVLESTPPGASVFVDGAEVGVTPMTSELAAGTHAIEFHRGDRTRKYDVNVVRGQQSVTNVDWGMKRAGTLQLESTPTGAKVQIDGRDYGVTPITVKDLAAGTHTLLLTTPEGTLKRSVTIAEDQTSQVSASIFSGFLHVSSPIELEISEGRQVIQLDDRSQALLKPGSHQLRFVNRALGFSETRNVEIKPGDVTSISVEPKLSTLSVTSTVSADVFVDGERIGATPLSTAPIRVGTREIVLKSAQGERRRTITVRANQPAQVDVDFSAP